MHALTVAETDRRSISFAPNESIRSINARIARVVESRSDIAGDISMIAGHFPLGVRGIVASRR